MYENALHFHGQGKCFHLSKRNEVFYGPHVSHIMNKTFSILPHFLSIVYRHYSLSFVFFWWVVRLVWFFSPSKRFQNVVDVVVVVIFTLVSMFCIFNRAGLFRIVHTFFFSMYRILMAADKRRTKEFHKTYFTFHSPFLPATRSIWLVCLHAADHCVHVSVMFSYAVLLYAYSIYLRFAPSSLILCLNR